MDCQGFGLQSCKSPQYGIEEFSVNLRRKIQLQIAVNEEFIEPTIDAIVFAARTGESGEAGDGKIIVLPIDDCIRIRTGNNRPDVAWSRFNQRTDCFPIAIVLCSNSILGLAVLALATVGR